MAEVRAAANAAVTGNFAGSGAPTPCSPLVFDSSTGDLYVLLAGDVVTLIGSVPAGSQGLIANRAFGPHLTPGALLGDASALLAQRVFRQALRGATWGGG